MLKITDLAVSKKLEDKEMAEVRGGFDAFAFLASTTIDNRVADVTQGFGLNLAQGNGGRVTNNQGIVGGNGTSHSPVEQSQGQYNAMAVSGIGNTYVGSYFD